MSEDLVLLELNARWGCALPFGWVPMTQVVGNSSELEIYVLESFVEWFDFDGIKSLLGNTFGISKVYEITEGGEVNFIELEDCVLDYDGLEHMYTDASFQFLLYFSHESTVTVSSQKLLHAIHQAWPAAASHFWIPAYWSFWRSDYHN